MNIEDKIKKTKRASFHSNKSKFAPTIGHRGYTRLFNFIGFHINSPFLT